MINKEIKAAVAKVQSCFDSVLETQRLLRVNADVLSNEAWREAMSDLRAEEDELQEAEQNLIELVRWSE